jgi:hypothetical protein
MKKNRYILPRSFTTQTSPGVQKMNGHSDELATKPTIQTVLERINAFEDRLQNQIGELQNEVALLKTDVGVLKTDLVLLKNDVGLIRFDLASFRDEFQLFRGEMEIRIDRIEGMTNQSRAEMLNLRADFREFKSQIKESVP